MSFPVVAGLRSLELGSPGASCQRLTALVLEGRKRATAGLVAEYEREGEPPEHVGERLALLDDDLYLRSARHSNAMARRLRDGVEAGLADGSIRDVRFNQPTEVNSVFASLPHDAADRLRQSFRFYDWDAANDEVRWVCSFDTQPEDVDAFVAAIARETTR